MVVPPSGPPPGTLPRGMHGGIQRQMHGGILGLFPTWPLSGPLDYTPWDATLASLLYSKLWPPNSYYLVTPLRNIYYPVNGIIIICVFIIIITWAPVSIICSKVTLGTFSGYGHLSYLTSDWPQLTPQDFWPQQCITPWSEVFPT